MWVNAGFYFSFQQYEDKLQVVTKENEQLKASHKQAMEVIKEIEIKLQFSQGKDPQGSLGKKSLWRNLQFDLVNHKKKIRRKVKSCDEIMVTRLPILGHHLMFWYKSLW